MDALDKLKGAWKAQDYSKDQVSTQDIYKMLHAKSSSYVKWIFYISIIEFVLLNSLYFFSSTKKQLEFFNEAGLKNIITISSIISTIIVFGFIYKFYKNYRNIIIDTSAKSLMNSILKTRKTVKYYIYTNLGIGFLFSSYIFYKIFSNSDLFKKYKVIQNMDSNQIPDNVLMIATFIGMILMVLLFLLFYRLIYGVLLRRLKKNYKELEQLDK